ncbi:hypothetical protein SFRURICE_002693, partial [Spodoptera frugiperda]
IGANDLQKECGIEIAGTETFKQVPQNICTKLKVGRVNRDVVGVNHSVVGVGKCKTECGFTSVVAVMKWRAVAGRGVPRRAPAPPLRVAV